MTQGRPAALEEAPGARALAAALAPLQGCQAATLLPSTLHLFWDMFGMLGTGLVLYALLPTHAVHGATHARPRVPSE